MKTFNRTYLPETIIYNGEIYQRNTTISNLNIQNSSLSDYIKTLKSTGIKVVLCNVLSKNLKGKTDLFHKPYQPTQWVFIHKKQ